MLYVTKGNCARDDRATERASSSGRKERELRATGRFSEGQRVHRLHRRRPGCSIRRLPTGLLKLPFARASAHVLARAHYARETIARYCRGDLSGPRSISTEDWSFLTTRASGEIHGTAVAAYGSASLSRLVAWATADLARQRMTRCALQPKRITPTIVQLRASIPRIFESHMRDYGQARKLATRALELVRTTSIPDIWSHSRVACSVKPRRVSGERRHRR